MLLETKGTAGVLSCGKFSGRREPVLEIFAGGAKTARFQFVVYCHPLFFRILTNMSSAWSLDGFVTTWGYLLLISVGVKRR